MSQIGTAHPDISIDDAISFLVNALKRAPRLDGMGAPNARNQQQGCDLFVIRAAETFYDAHLPAKRPLTERQQAPFYDAAWELSRRGVLRPGPAFPEQTYMGHPEGNGFSLTSFGRDWIEKYDQPEPFPMDPGRFSALMTSYGNLFGSGFVQRTNEAGGCYRALLYFACCAMCGAASESVLLAVAIAKTKDEATVLDNYRRTSGRQKLLAMITTGQNASTRGAVDSAIHLLAYWRDAAAHGLSTSITEFEAHDAMARLLRFAQFASENWSALTAEAGR